MNVAIITAAGKGTRLKSNISKQFLNIYGKPILAHTISIFQKTQKIDEIYISVPHGYVESCQKDIIDKYSFSKVKGLVVGGSHRQESVYNVLIRIPSTSKIVLIHDGVRPIITPDEIEMTINRLIKDHDVDNGVRGIILAAPARETIKRINDDTTIDATIPRENVWHAQTPQTFFYTDILEAHRKAAKEGFIGTDDSSLVERMGWKVSVARGRHENIKITTPIDLFLAELMISKNGKT
ncbi:MAG: 2-C-methyl-D-erythritol 4-phosphate cytidylyltransferase [Actinobacteria bacterium]|nr:2-C-methyl-D-erythritol 4-phosphate cytidylyltransferase [Actinomycetota bacterium]